MLFFLLERAVLSLLASTYEFRNEALTGLAKSDTFVSIIAQFLTHCNDAIITFYVGQTSICCSYNCKNKKHNYHKKITVKNMV